MISLGVLFFLPVFSSADTLFGTSGWDVKTVAGGKINNLYYHPRRNEIWVAESAGVLVFDGSSKELIKTLPVDLTVLPNVIDSTNTFFTANALPGPVNDLVFDDSGYVWIGTDKGLCSFTETAGEYKIYTAPDSFSFLGVFKSKYLSGKAVKSLVACWDGIVQLLPPPAPPVRNIIDAILAGTDVTVTYASLASFPIPALPGDSITYWQNSRQAQTEKWPVRKIAFSGSSRGSYFNRYIFAIDDRDECYWSSFDEGISLWARLDSSAKWDAVFGESWPYLSSTQIAWFGCKKNTNSPYLRISVNGNGDSVCPLISGSFDSTDNIRQIVVDTDRVLWGLSDSCVFKIPLDGTYLGDVGQFLTYLAAKKAQRQHLDSTTNLVLQKFPRSAYSSLNVPYPVPFGLNPSGHLMIGGKGQIVEWTGATAAVPRPTVNLRPVVSQKVLLGIYSLDGKLVSREQNFQSRTFRPGIYLFKYQIGNAVTVEKRNIASLR
jgi:hypothetical protein